MTNIKQESNQSSPIRFLRKLFINFKTLKLRSRAATGQGAVQLNLQIIFASSKVFLNFSNGTNVKVSSKSVNVSQF